MLSPKEKIRIFQLMFVVLTVSPGNDFVPYSFLTFAVCNGDAGELSEQSGYGVASWEIDVTSLRDWPFVLRRERYSCYLMVVVKEQNFSGGFHQDKWRAMTSDSAHSAITCARRTVTGWVRCSPCKTYFPENKIGLYVCAVVGNCERTIAHQIFFFF